MRLGLRHFWRGRAGIQHSHAAVSVDGGKDLLRPWLGKPAGVTTKRRNSFEAIVLDFVEKLCDEIGKATCTVDFVFQCRSEERRVGKEWELGAEDGDVE